MRLDSYHWNIQFFQKFNYISRWLYHLETSTIFFILKVSKMTKIKNRLKIGAKDIMNFEFKLEFPFSIFLDFFLV